MFADSFSLAPDRPTRSALTAPLNARTMQKSSAPGLTDYFLAPCAATAAAPAAAASGSRYSPPATFGLRSASRS